MRHLIIKELKDIFSSWFGALAILAFVIVSGVFLWVFPSSSYFTYGYATPELFFEFGYYLLLFIIPILTVGFFSNEFRNGTFEILSVLPLSWRKIVLAKFVVGLTIIILIILSSLPVIYVLKQSSQNGFIDFAQTGGSYIGLFLIGACFVSISVAVSSFFDNPSVAFLIAIVIGFIFYSGFDFISSLPVISDSIAFITQKFGLRYHGDYLSRGVIPLWSITYLLSVTTIFLLIAETKLKTRSF